MSEWRNRFDLVPAERNLTDRSAALTVLGAVTHRIAEIGEERLGADRARDTYRAAYSALFADRTDLERDLDLRRRLPYAYMRPWS